MNGSDIIDWAFLETGLPFDQAKPAVITPEAYHHMFVASPVVQMDKIQCPTLIILGLDDKRVPPYQGMELHYHLLSRGIDSRFVPKGLRFMSIQVGVV